MNGFWTGGADACNKALREQHDAELAKLRTQLESAATESQRQDIQQQIARLTEIYRAKSRAVGRGLF